MSVTVPGVGPSNARLVVIGEAPGRGEVEHDPPTPFVGPSGRILNDALGHGVRDQTYITNVRKILPRKGEKAKEKQASLAEWLPVLEAELAKLTEARTLLLVGADALNAVVGIPYISLFHASCLTRGEAEGIRGVPQIRANRLVGLPPRLHTIVATLHPAYALRGKPQFKPMIKTTMARAARWANQDDGPGRPTLDGFNLEASVDELDEFLAWAQTQHQAVSIDVETPIDNPTKIEIAGVATTEKLLVFPWGLGYEQVIREFLARPGIVVGHNITYDLNALAAYGIEPGPMRRCVDTIAAGQLCWPPFAEAKKARWLALATCVMRVHDGISFWKGIPKKDAPPDNRFRDAMYAATWPDLSPALFPRLYCGLDNYHTIRLWPAQRAILHREGML